MTHLDGITIKDRVPSWPYTMLNSGFLGIHDGGGARPKWR